MFLKQYVMGGPPGLPTCCPPVACSFSSLSKFCLRERKREERENKQYAMNVYNLSWAYFSIYFKYLQQGSPKNVLSTYNNCGRKLSKKIAIKHISTLQHKFLNCVLVSCCMSLLTELLTNSAGFLYESIPKEP